MISYSIQLQEIVFLLVTGMVLDNAKENASQDMIVLVYLGINVTTTITVT